MSAPEDHELCPVCLEIYCDHSQDEKDAHVRAIASGEDRPINAGDEAQVQKVAKAAKQRDRQDVGDLRWVMSDARGRRFVWAMLSRAGIFRSSYLAGRGQSEATAFYEGERNIGLELMASVALDVPKAYAAMQEENKP